MQLKYVVHVATLARTVSRKKGRICYFEITRSRVGNSFLTLISYLLRRGRHWVWGPNRRRAIKEWSIAINNDWVDN